MTYNEYDLVFADAVFSCQITGKICPIDGYCSECIVASYFLEFYQEDD